MGFFKNLFGQAGQINDYFANAIRVCYVLGDKNAIEAALVAAKVADKKQRKSMVDYIVGMASDLGSLPMDSAEEKKMMENAINNLLILKTDIEIKDWGIRDIIAAKKSLATTSPDLAVAIDPPVNPNIFIEKYPEIFKD